jgi:hypothetical protein
MVWFTMTSEAALLFVLAGWTLYIALVHVIAGGRRILAPMLAATVPPFVRATLAVVWHMITFFLVLLAAAIAAAAITPTRAPLIALAAIVTSVFMVVFMRIAKTELGAAILLPQWLLFAPLAVSLTAALTEHPAMYAGAALLGALAVAHLAWAAGLPWPARDLPELAAHVMPGGLGRGAFPGRGPTVVVAVALAAMAASVVAPALGSALRWPASAIAAVFAARGVFGLAYRPWSSRGTSKPFGIYNTLVFSPGCLLVAALVALAARA